MRQDTSYSHKQVGTLVIAVMSILGLAVAIASGFMEGWPIMFAMLALFGIIAIVFGSMTVEVENGHMQFWFGTGLIRKSYEIRDIDSAAVVKNRWYYGWGIRLTPHGWLYNVSGMMPVKLTLVSGKTLLVGSDEPVDLVKAIDQAKANLEDRPETGRH